MLKIYLVRHGQDQDNASGILNGRRDTPLTKLGEAQAHEVAEKIKNFGIVFDAVYTSPLKRTKMTAEIISSDTNSPKPIVLENLIERDFGIMTGEPATSIKEKCAPNILQAELITYFLSPEGAETFPDMIIRAKTLLDAIKSQHKDASVLLVSHGDFGKMLYAAFYDLPWKDVLLQFHFGNSELLLLSENSPGHDAHVFKIQQFNA